MALRLPFLRNTCCVIKPDAVKYTSNQKNGARQSVNCLNHYLVYHRIHWALLMWKYNWVLAACMRSVIFCVYLSTAWHFCYFLDRQETARWNSYKNSAYAVFPGNRPIKLGQIQPAYGHRNQASLSFFPCFSTKSGCSLRLRIKQMWSEHPGFVENMEKSAREVYPINQSTIEYHESGQTLKQKRGSHSVN